MNQNQLNDAFWQALHEERFTDAGQYLSQGADINARNMRDQTAFLLYAGDARMGIAEWLKDHGADINAKDRQNKTALHNLVDRTLATRDYRTLATFLTWKPNLNIEDSQGRTPLTIAALSPKAEEIVKMLLDAGSDPNVVPLSGATALLGAASQGYQETVLALLDKNAFPGQIDNDGKTLWHALVSSFDSELLEKVLAKNLNVDINRPSKSGSTPLSSAVDLGDVSSAIILLKNGADPNVRSTNRFGMGATCLQMMILYQPVEGAMDLLKHKKKRGEALKNEATDESKAQDEAKNLDLVRMAIDAGADVWAVDSVGRNAWHYLAMRPVFSKEIFDMLAEQGLPMDEPTGPGGRNPLSAIFEQHMKPYGRQQALQHMLSAGFPTNPPFTELSQEYKDNNPEEADRFVLSPLAMAVLTRARYEAQVLLDHGADPNRLDSSGMSPLYFAVGLQLSQQEMQAMEFATMTGRMKDPEKDMEKLVDNVNTQRNWLIDAMLKHGGNPMQEMNHAQKKTPFLRAIDANIGDVVRQFIDAGVDPMQPNSVGDYGVLEALNQGKLELFYTLKDYVEKQGRGEELKNILIDSAMTSPEKWEQRMPYLEVLRTLDEPSWINHQDSDGNTPLIVAAATSQEDLVDLLLSKGANPDTKNHAGETAMMHALLNEKGDIVKSLRQFGATNKDVNPHGDTLEQMSHATGLRHVIKALVDELEPNAEIAEFVKPHEQTVEALKKLPEFISDWNRPRDIMEDPTPAEPPKEKENAKPKKTGMFGF